MSLSMSRPLRIRRPLSTTVARTVARDRDIVAQGLVDTGSPFDGLHIRRIYQAIRAWVVDGQLAYELTALVWKDRAGAYQAGRIDWQAALRLEEPWSYEPPAGFWEDA